MSGSFADKRSARLAVVQGLYTMELSGATTAMVEHEAKMGRLPIENEDGGVGAELDEALFAALLSGAVEQQAAIDQTIAARLASGWRLERLDAVARAVLRAGVTELLRFPNTPIEIVINDYVEIAHMFFDGPEPAFINATLDGIAKRLDASV